MATLHRCLVCRRLFSDSELCPHDGQQGVEAEVEDLPSVLEQKFGPAEPFIIGDTGIGYLVQEGPNGQKGLLKVLRFVSEIHASEWMRIKRELSKQPGLHPRCLVPIMETGEEAADQGGDRSLCWLFREWVEGVSLKVFLKREGALDVQTALAIATQIATGLDGLHRAGLLHRDLKPGHVILQPQESGVPHVFLIDAGIAGRIENDSLFSTVGTPAYLSPEQAAGKLVSFRSDLYALGCVLYEMLEGMPPFVGADTKALIEAHKNEPAPAPTVGLPDGIATLMASMLAKEPRQRPFSAQQIRRALEPFVHVSTPHARATTVPARSGAQPITVPPLRTATGVAAPAPPSSRPSAGRNSAPPPPPRAASSSLSPRPGDSGRASAPPPPPVGRISAPPLPGSVLTGGAAERTTPEAKKRAVRSLPPDAQPSPGVDDETTMEIPGDQLVEVLETAATISSDMPPSAIPEEHTTPAVGQPPDSADAPRRGLARREEKRAAGSYQGYSSATNDFDKEAFEGQAGGETSGFGAEGDEEDVDVDVDWEADQPDVAGMSEADSDVDVISSRELEPLEDARAEEKAKPAAPAGADVTEPVSAGAEATVVPGLVRLDRRRAVAIVSGGILLAAMLVYALIPDDEPAELAASQIDRGKRSDQEVQQEQDKAAGPSKESTTGQGLPKRQDKRAEQVQPDTERAAGEQESAPLEREGERGEREPGAAGRAEPRSEAAADDLGQAAEARSSRRARARRDRTDQKAREKRRAASARAAEESEAAAAQSQSAQSSDPTAQGTDGSSEAKRAKAEELRAEGREHYRAGRYRKAAAAYLKATRQSPSHAGAFAGLGAASLAMGDVDTAIAAYQRAIRLSPSSSGFHAALGRSYSRKGDRKRAVAAYRKALQLNPNNQAAKWALERLGER